MRKSRGFTVIELLIAMVIFSMITSLVFYSLTQAISLWERAEKEIKKLDKIIFFNHWFRDLFHSTENLALVYGDKNIPIFLGEQGKVVFVSSNPLMRKVISIVKIELKNGGIYYSEENIYKNEISLKNLSALSFEDEFEMLSPVEEGTIFYLRPMKEEMVWDEEFHSDQMFTLPRSVKIVFLYQGKKVELISNIISDPKPKELILRLEF